MSTQPETSPPTADAAKESTSRYATSWLARDVLHPLLCCLIATAQMVGLFIVVATIAAPYPVISVTLLAFVVALEGVATTRWLESRDRLLYEHSSYRCAELVGIVVAVRLTTWLMFGELSTPGDLGRVIFDLNQILTGDFLATVIVVLLAWARATHLDALTRRTSLSEEQVAAYQRYRSRSDRDQYLPRLAQSRATLTRELSSTWTWGAVFVIVCAGLSSLQLSGLENPVNPFSLSSRGLHPLMSTALLVYFVGGIWLVSRCRLAAMNEWWLASEAAKRDDVDKAWSRTAFGVVAASIVLATALPAGTYVPALEWVGVGALALVHGFNLLAALVLGLFASFINLISPEVTAPALPMDSPPAPDLPGGIPMEGALLRIDLEPMLWTLMVMLTLMTLVYFVRGRFAPPWRLLRRLWRHLVNWIGRVRTGAATTGARGRFGMTPRTRGGQTKTTMLADSRKAPDRRSARGKMIAVYRQMLRRTASAGAKRSSEQTPREFAANLYEQWPRAHDDVEVLTRGFSKARYTTEEITDADLDAVRRSLGRFRSELKKWMQSTTSPD